MQTERPEIVMVTRNGGYNKDRIFQAAMPEWNITRRDPIVNERLIQEFAPTTEERPVFISEAKARLDAPWVAAVCLIAELFTEYAKVTRSKVGLVYLYADSVQFIHEPDGTLTIHEKPVGDAVEWAEHSPDAIAQSGKTVEIVSALTAIRCSPDGVSDPATVIVRAKATMRPFTRPELVEYAKGSGRTVIPDTAGGISLANGGRQFYDTSKPLTISVQDSITDEPKEMLSFDDWSHVPDAALRPFVCGAFEPAVVRLVGKTKLTPPVVS